jgi:hypothetical protein
VELPDIDRTPIDQPEDHIGQVDWKMAYTVAFYFDFDDQDTYHQAEAATVIEAWIKAIDANQDLGMSGTVQEAKVIHAGPFSIDDTRSRAMLLYPTRVELLAFI